MSIPIPSSALASPLSLTFPSEGSGFAVVPVVSPRLHFQVYLLPQTPMGIEKQEAHEKGNAFVVQ